MTVGVFGTWRATEGDLIYRVAVDYGRALGTAGHCVLTGGYSGVMEAACRGAAEAGGRTIGVTCPELDRLLPVNSWVAEEVKTRDLQERLATSLRRIDAALFCPGRSGTMTELSFALELREKGTLLYPVFLSCEFWDDVLLTYAAVNSKLPYPTSDSSAATLFTHCSGPVDVLKWLAASR
jgi:uncharacterized protein (TIGR00725 family)